jgi:putative flippase GtrA
MTRLPHYAAVGAVATAVHYGLLVLLVEFAHWPAWISAGLGAVLGAQVAYLGNRALTFAHRGAVRRSWPRFQVTAMVGALLGMAIVALAQSLGWHYLAGQAAATLLAMLLTYAINRRWTFSTTPDRG